MSKKTRRRALVRLTIESLCKGRGPKSNPAAAPKTPKNVLPQDTPSGVLGTQFTRECVSRSRQSRHRPGPRCAAGRSQPFRARPAAAAPGAPLASPLASSYLTTVLYETRVQCLCMTSVPANHRFGPHHTYTLLYSVGTRGGTRAREPCLAGGKGVTRGSTRG